MDELDKNLPDDFWRKTFEDAAEMPQPRVWATIEQRLDESKGPKVLPLWGTGLASSRPLVWGSLLAASVALLLVGWWVVTTQSVTQPTAPMQIASQSSNRGNGAKSVDQSVSTRTALAVNKAPNVQSDALATTKSLPKSPNPFGRSAGSLMANSAVQDEVVQGKKSINGVNLSNVTEKISPISGEMQAATPMNSQSAKSRVGVSYASNEHTPSGNTESEQTAFSLFNRLSGKPLRMRRPGMISRIVWVRPAELTTEPDIRNVKRQPRELWASVSMMPGSFNPSVSVRSMQTSLPNTSYVTATAPNQASVSSRANFSVAYQAGAGMQLNEHWSVESGIGYLSGRSTVETPGQRASAQMDLLGNRNTVTTNVFVDAVRNSIQPTGSTLALASNANLSGGAYQANIVPDSRELQLITNNYQYVQVPVQLGYQLRPRKKLSMAVLGGILTNIFVRNTIGDALVVTSKDGVYRPVSLAATMGARLRYRPSRQWSASLAGVYQPSLESSTKADSQVQSHPTSTGMSFGLDYHF
ncbi:outer membrane beta-barrel protein [Spirosoma pollinicola]|uniref:Outer membrane protein beta-barrel domain-containing protein n=1 Tax=Spirosoma pollinicola TaxID=2057025 RepID=A0A2K8Z721_9BACT|nr:outer membrane beta-barrel protein [Spirosoma pollinicola]AUD05634.1 hypothetical protein CWM47_29600 [Spirosoma pollinicola]